jgi:hypothetical protein
MLEWGLIFFRDRRVKMSKPKILIGSLLVMLSLNAKAEDITTAQFITDYCSTTTSVENCENITAEMAAYLGAGEAIAKSFAGGDDPFVSATGFYAKPNVETEECETLTFGSEGSPGTATCPVSGHKVSFGKVPGTHSVVYYPTFRTTIADTAAGGDAASVDAWVAALGDALADLGSGDRLILDDLGRLGFTSSGSFSFSGVSVTY